MPLDHLRSLLFAPAIDERKLGKALASVADGVVADLEDAVAPPDKAAAREVVARAFAGATATPYTQDVQEAAPHPGRGRDPLPTRPTIPGSGARQGANSAPILRRPLRLLRVNGVATPWFAEDLALAAQLNLDAIVLPKASSEGVAALGSSGPPVIAIVESALGLREAYEIATADRVAALLLGAVDLGAEVGLEPRPDAQEILYARSKVAIDSTAAGLRGPIDVVHLDLRDDAGLEEQCRLARALGFRGKACIHPAQLPTINRLFAPSERDIQWARDVVEAFEGQTEGVLALNGTMIDLPVVTRARRILAEVNSMEPR